MGDLYSILKSTLEITPGREGGTSKQKAFPATMDKLRMHCQADQKLRPSKSEASAAALPRFPAKNSKASRCPLDLMTSSNLRFRVWLMEATISGQIARLGIDEARLSNTDT